MGFPYILEPLRATQMPGGCTSVSFWVRTFLALRLVPHGRIDYIFYPSSFLLPLLFCRFLSSILFHVGPPVGFIFVLHFAGSPASSRTRFWSVTGDWFPNPITRISGTATSNVVVDHSCQVFWRLWPRWGIPWLVPMGGA